MPAINIGIIVIVGVLGLVVGSFLNVVIYRVPLGRSIVSPRSACPACGEGIKPWDNVPVLSWVVLKARCRNCAEPISVRYPLVELGTGLLFAAVALRFSQPREEYEARPLAERRDPDEALRIMRLGLVTTSDTYLPFSHGRHAWYVSPPTALLVERFLTSP